VFPIPSIVSPQQMQMRRFMLFGQETTTSRGEVCKVEAEAVEISGHSVSAATWKQL